jgi:hypothetical protein
VPGAPAAPIVGGVAVAGGGSAAGGAGTGASSGFTAGELHLALGHTAVKETFEIAGKTFEGIDPHWLDNFARGLDAITYQNKLFSDIRETYKDPVEFAPKLIDTVVQMGGRISFSLKGVDVENVIAGIGEGWTDEELRYIAGNPTARAVTTFFHGIVPF